jgi:hypothetical protein
VARKRLPHARPVEVVDVDEERAAADRLHREALVVPAMVRLRDLVAWVGAGRPATQAGNLRPAVAVAAAAELGLDDAGSVEVRSIDDLPRLAHVFHWAVAAGFLAIRATKVVAGRRAADLEGDPVGVWLDAVTTLLAHGLLDGFRQGWRKTYVELLDAEALGLLAAILEAGGAAQVAAIEQTAWDHVALEYGYDPEDNDERAYVVRLVAATLVQLADVGIATRDGGAVTLTGLGRLLAAAAVVAREDD